MKPTKRVGAGAPGTTREPPTTPKPVPVAKPSGRIGNLGDYAHAPKKGSKKS